MSSIINSLTTEQFDAIITAYGTIIAWAEQMSNVVVTSDIIM